MTDNIFDTDITADISTGFVNVGTKPSRYRSVPPYIKVVPWEAKNRYIIKDVKQDKIIDNARGWGYRSKESAEKSAYFLVNKEVYEEDRKEAQKFILNHPNEIDRLRNKIRRLNKIDNIEMPYEEIIEEIMSWKFPDTPKYGIKQLPYMLSGKTF